MNNETLTSSPQDSSSSSWLNGFCLLELPDNDDVISVSSHLHCHTRRLRWQQTVLAAFNQLQMFAGVAVHPGSAQFRRPIPERFDTFSQSSAT